MKNVLKRVLGLALASSALLFGTSAFAQSSLVCNGAVEGFESGVPSAGWTVQTNEPAGPQWSNLADCGEAGNFTNGTGDAACVSSDVFGGAEMDTSLVTPAFSLVGFTAASLDYTVNYQNLAGSDFLDVDISTNGGTTWTNLLSWNEDHGSFRATPGEDVSIDLSAYAGQSGLQLRYRYYDPNSGDWDWYAQVDNVALACSGGGANPNIDVSPLSMASTQATNTSTNQLLNIANTGGAASTLNWTLAEEPVPVLAPIDDLAMKQQIAAAAANLRATHSSDTGSRGVSTGGPAPIQYTSPANFSEGFDDVTVLPGQGWFLQNNSQPQGLLDGWYQGVDTVFPAHAGAPTAYTAANFNAIAGAGTISDWMLTPEINLTNGDTFSFWTRTATGSDYPDRLELRLSTAGSSTNVGTLGTDVGDFTTLLLSVNPTLTVGGYPEVWTQYTATLSGIPGGATGRIAFRYFVTDGGPDGNNSSYIGVDTVEYTTAGPPGPCQAPSDIPWLSLDMTAGANAGGTNTNVTVTFDSTGYGAGVYTGNVCVNSNDPDAGPGNGTDLVIVPVEMTVTAAANWTVTPIVVGGNGSTMPSTPQSVPDGGTTAFTLTPDAGYEIDTVTGCGGTLVGNVYTTGPITADCTVSASFRLTPVAAPARLVPTLNSWVLGLLGLLMAGLALLLWPRRTG